MGRFGCVNLSTIQIIKSVKRRSLIFISNSSLENLAAHCTKTKFSPAVCYLVDYKVCGEYLDSYQIQCLLKCQIAKQNYRVTIGRDGSRWKKKLFKIVLSILLLVICYHDSFVFSINTIQSIIECCAKVKRYEVNFTRPSFSNPPTLCRTTDTRKLLIST